MSLHLRALRAGPLVGCALTFAALAIGALMLRASKDGSSADLELVVGAFLVASASGVLSLGLVSPCGELEAAGARNVTSRTVAVYCAALALAVVALIVQVGVRDADTAIICRGAVGAGALGVVGAVLLGPGSGWAVPVLGVLAPMILDQLGAALGIIAWYTYPAGSAAAWSGVLLATAVAAVLVATLGLRPGRPR